MEALDLSAALLHTIYGLAHINKIRLELEFAPSLLGEFVEKIVIHESESLDGKRWGSSADKKTKSSMGGGGRVGLPDT